MSWTVNPKLSPSWEGFRMVVPDFFLPWNVLLYTLMLLVEPICTQIKKSPTLGRSIDGAPKMFHSFVARKSNQRKAVQTLRWHKAALFLKLEAYGSNNHYNR